VFNYKTIVDFWTVTDGRRVANWSTLVIFRPVAYCRTVDDSSTSIVADCRAVSCCRAVENCRTGA